MITFSCDNCSGVRWVCESHPRMPWRAVQGCRCGGAGMPFPVCNSNRPSLHPEWPQEANYHGRRTKMKDPVDLVLCEPAPFLFGANGHFSVTDGSSVWIVVVTCRP